MMLFCCEGLACRRELDKESTAPLEMCEDAPAEGKFADARTSICTCKDYLYNYLDNNEEYQRIWKKMNEDKIPIVCGGGKNISPGLNEYTCGRRYDQDKCLAEFKQCKKDILEPDGKWRKRWEEWYEAKKKVDDEAVMRRMRLRKYYAENFLQCVDEKGKK